MAAVKTGDKVSINLTYKTPDGVVISTKDGGKPIEFVVGENLVFEPVDQLVVGMQPGEERTGRVEQEQSIPYQKELVRDFPKNAFPSDVKWEKGKYISFNGDDGHIVQLLIVDFTDELVTLDGNPPIAGKAFDVEMELLEILDSGEGS